MLGVLYRWKASRDEGDGNNLQKNRLEMKTRAFSLLTKAIVSIDEAQLRPLIDTSAPLSTVMGYIIRGMMRDELLSFEELQQFTTERLKLS